MVNSMFVCFVIEELWPPEVDKRVCEAIHSCFSLSLRNGDL